MTTTDALLSLGVDAREGLAHMDGNAALYRHFLARFPYDDSLERLTQALDLGDAQQAFACAHALKGLSAQLGLTRLGEQADALSALLRGAKPGAPEAIRAQMACLVRAHRQALRAIHLLLSRNMDL